MTATAQSPRGERVLALDGARALAVVAMVFGHTFSALVSAEGRGVPWVQAYWHVRAFTSPLFLFVSGWVLFFVITRRGLTGTRVLTAYLPRVVLLFTLGYLLRLPIWDLAGLFRFDPQVWRAFSTFDALQCIAAAMTVSLLVSSVLRSTVARVAVLVTVAVAIVLGAGSVWSWLGRPQISGVVAQTFGGGDSLFPIFPWTAYFFAGASLGALVKSRASALGAVALVAALVAASWWPWSKLPVTEPMRFVGGIAIVSAVVTLALLIPKRFNQTVAGVGRASLWVYVLHLPLVYGWGYWPGMAQRVGHVLSDLEALGVALAMVVGCVAVGVQAQRLLGGGRWRRPFVQLGQWALRRARRPAPLQPS